MNRILIISMTAAALAATAAPLAAQQAGPDYDQTAPITLEGTADTIEWSNAGGKLMLQPTAGAPMWEIALPDTATLMAKGVSANLLTRGVTVKVRAYKAKDAACNPNCKAQGIDLTVGGAGKTFALLGAGAAGL
jgi:hypothetical protein